MGIIFLTSSVFIDLTLIFLRKYYYVDITLLLYEWLFIQKHGDFGIQNPALLLLEILCVINAKVWLPPASNDLLLVAYPLELMT